jgi:electron transfer flavoprotein beta subunit
VSISETKRGDKVDIIVCAKQVVDVSEIKINPTSKKPMVDVARKISDIDKNAMEEALKIKEKHGGKITVLSLGLPEAKENIKELLAVGGDEAVIIKGTGNEDYYDASRLLAEGIKKIGKFDIILCGEASIDKFSGQMGPRLAGLLGIPQIAYAQKIEAEENEAKVEKNLGDRIVSIHSPYPLLITVTKEINEPRLPSLMQILASSNKPIKEWDAHSVIEATNPKVEIIDIKGIDTKRKNIVYEEGNIEEHVKSVTDNLIKDGVVG